MTKPIPAEDAQGRKAAIETLTRMVREIRVGMLTTQMGSGALRSRPMLTVKHDFDGDLWFISEAAEGKVQEINRNPEIGLTYAEPREDRYVSLSGTASIVHDQAKLEVFWWKNKPETIRAEFLWGPIDGHIETLPLGELQEQVIVVIERIPFEDGVSRSEAEAYPRITAAQYKLGTAKEGVRYQFVRVVPLEQLLEAGLDDHEAGGPANPQYVRWPHEGEGRQEG